MHTFFSTQITEISVIASSLQVIYYFASATK